MVTAATLLVCVALLLGISALAVTTLRWRGASTLVYGLCAAVALALLGLAGTFLIAGAPGPSDAVLPLGLPWIGARFRLDALSAFFLIVVNLGALAASVYAVGYGRREAEPGRVLPFYPAFLAGCGSWRFNPGWGRYR